jgi:hypothetical protein
MSLMTRGVAMLIRRMPPSAGETVTYLGATDRSTKPGESATIEGVWFGTPEGLATTPEARVTSESDDVDAHIPVASLVLDGVAVTPAKGDRMTRTIGGLPVVVEVRPRSDVEPLWTYSDAGRTLYRVRTQKVSG